MIAVYVVVKACLRLYAPSGSGHSQECEQGMGWSRHVRVPNSARCRNPRECRNATGKLGRRDNHQSGKSEDLPERVASARGRGRPMRMDEGGIIPPNQ